MMRHRAGDGRGFVYQVPNPQYLQDDQERDEVFKALKMRVTLGL